MRLIFVPLGTLVVERAVAHTPDNAAAPPGRRIGSGDARQHGRGAPLAAGLVQQLPAYRRSISTPTSRPSATARIWTWMSGAAGLFARNAQPPRRFCRRAAQHGRARQGLNTALESSRRPRSDSDRRQDGAGDQERCQNRPDVLRPVTPPRRRRRHFSAQGVHDPGEVNLSRRGRTDG